MAKVQYFGTGRRKCSVARVRLVPGEGKIKINLTYSEDGLFNLIISDNGIGLPEDIDIEKTDTLGLRLINILVNDQLEGNLTIDRSHGTKLIINFKMIK